MCKFFDFIWLKTIQLLGIIIIELGYDKNYAECLRTETININEKDYLVRHLT